MNKEHVRLSNAFITDRIITFLNVEFRMDINNDIKIGAWSDLYWSYGIWLALTVPRVD